MNSKRQVALAGMLLGLIVILGIAILGGYFQSDDPFTLSAGAEQPVNPALEPWQAELERHLDDAQSAVRVSLAKLPEMSLADIRFPTAGEVRRYQDNCRHYFEFRNIEIETYQQQTSDAAELRELVVELLKKYHQCAADLQEFDDTKPELQMLSQKVLEQRTDHLIPKLYATRLQTDWQNEEDRARMQQVANEAASAALPLVTRLEGRSSLLDCAKNSGATNVAPYVSQYLDVLVEWMESLPETSVESRFIWRWLIGLWGDAPTDQEHLEILKRLAHSARPDPWIVHLFAGRYYESLGWKARGKSWVSQVTAAGWTNLNELVSRAGRHYAYAWHLRPDFPEPAGHMISVVMGVNDLMFGSMSQWFQRSIDAEIDHGWAYRQYQWYLRPRWGTDYDDLLTFGEKCLDTGRFDTSAPQFLLHGLIRVQLSDFGQAESVFDLPRARPLLEKYLSAFWREVGEQPASDGSIETLPANSPLLRSKLAALCVKAGLYQDARRVLEGLPESNRWLRSAFDDCWESLDLGVAAAYASTEDDGFVQSVMRQVRNGFEPRTTPAEFQSLVDQLLSRESQSKNPNAKRFYEQALVIVRRAQAFAAGEWVPLTFDHDLAGWRVFADEWKVIDRDHVRLIDRRPNKLLQLDLLNHFPPPYVVDVTIEHHDRNFLLPDIGIVVGPRDMVSDSSRLTVRSFQIHSSLSYACVNGTQEGGAHLSGPIESAARHQLRVKVWPEAYSLYVDGALVLDQIDNRFAPTHWLGFGNGEPPQASGATNGEVELSHIRIRKLSYSSPPILHANDYTAFASNSAEHHARELAFDPEDVWAKYRWGATILAQEPQNEKALQEILAAVERCPRLHQHQAALFIGYGYQGQRKYSEAAEWLRRQEQLTPDHPGTLETLAIFLACCPDERLRNGSDALRLADRALNSGKGWNAHWARAAALAELNRFAEAETAIAEALRLAPNSHHEQLQQRRSEFQQRKPYRFPPSQSVTGE
jgi:tetratricopeptide (TPR) repeat protein